jgi:hypothetical protein
MSAGWFVVIGAAIGILGSLGASWLTEARLDRRIERQREAEREQQRRAFQRETLIALQDWLLRVVRSASRIALHDAQHNRQAPAGGQRFGVPIPEDLAQESLLAHQEVAKLIERVIDDEVRQLVKEVTAAATVIGFTPQRSELAEPEMEAAYLRTTERIGVVLRATL